MKAIRIKAAAPQWRNNNTGQVEEHNIRLIGAAPNMRRLDGCVALDAEGFIKTGADLTPEDLSAARWPLTRLRIFGLEFVKK